MTKADIITASDTIFKQLDACCNAIDENLFFKRPENKWSAAENMQHLILSTNTTALAYWLPAFLIKWMAGTPNRASRTYQEVKDKYYRKLSEGATASAKFVPKPIDINFGKQQLMRNWEKATNKFINALQKTERKTIWTVTW
ncbi:MAG: hypothetical protein IPL84_01240 [Chitinophagaceae bacterium]|nr:hypothetical protein [Chitinophagaceae bacterium]